MFGLDIYQFLFVVSALLFQLILIAHFALRKWHFDVAVRYGPLVYACSLPAAALSIFLFRGGMSWSFWLSGLIFLAWALFGFWVEYRFKIEWRDSLRSPILVPYVVLYLAAVMFYWWPLALVYKPLWYVYAFLFAVSTYLNVTSHKSGASSPGAEARRAI